MIRQIIWNTWLCLRLAKQQFNNQVTPRPGIFNAQSPYQALKSTSSLGTEADRVLHKDFRTWTEHSLSIIANCIICQSHCHSACATTYFRKSSRTLLLDCQLGLANDNLKRTDYDWLPNICSCVASPWSTILVMIKNHYKNLNCLMFWTGEYTYKCWLIQWNQDRNLVELQWAKQYLNKGTLVWCYTAKIFSATITVLNLQQRLNHHQNYRL
jgi:hypothetical protein